MNDRYMSCADLCKHNDDCIIINGAGRVWLVYIELLYTVSIDHELNNGAGDHWQHIMYEE